MRQGCNAASSRSLCASRDSRPQHAPRQRCSWLALRWPKLVWAHFPAALWGAVIEFAGWICPLTPLENFFRQAAGDADYAGGFVEHYLLPTLYPHALTREIQVAMGVAVLVLNLIVYTAVWRRRRRTG